MDRHRHTHARTHARARKQHTKERTRIYTQHAYTHKTQTHAKRTHARTHACTHARMHARMHARTHARTRTHTHTNTSTDTFAWYMSTVAWSGTLSPKLGTRPSSMRVACRSLDTDSFHFWAGEWGGCWWETVRRADGRVRWRGGGSIVLGGALFSALETLRESWACDPMVCDLFCCEPGDGIVGGPVDAGEGRGPLFCARR